MNAFVRMPAGPRPPFESAAHLYFGWGWAAGRLIAGAAGRPVPVAVRDGLGKPLGIESEVSIGMCEDEIKLQEDGNDLVQKPPEVLDSRVYSCDSVRPILHRASVDLMHSVQLPEGVSADAASLASSSASYVGESDAAAGDDASGADGALDEDDQDAAGYDSCDEAEDIEASILTGAAASASDGASNPNPHLMRAGMGAMALLQELQRAGAADLEGLARGGLEHLADPRIVNAQKTRRAALPSLTGFASARALAAAVCATQQQLVAAGGDTDVVLELDEATGLVSTVARGEEAALPATAPLLGAKGATGESSTVRMRESARKACSLLGFHPVRFRSGVRPILEGDPEPGSGRGSPQGGALVDPRDLEPQFHEEVHGYGIGGLGGSFVVCHVAADVTIAVTLNRIVPDRSVAQYIARALGKMLGIGMPVDV